MAQARTPEIDQLYQEVLAYRSTKDFVSILISGNLILLARNDCFPLGFPLRFKSGCYLATQAGLQDHKYSDLSTLPGIRQSVNQGFNGLSSLVSSIRSKPCILNGYRVFSMPKTGEYPLSTLYFSEVCRLLCRYAPDEIHHPIRAVPAHLFRDVAVNVQRKRCRRVPQIALHRLDVVPRFDRRHGVRVAQIVEPYGRETEPCHDALKAVVHGSVGQAVSDLIPKHQIVGLLLRSAERVEHGQLVPHLSGGRLEDNSLDIRLAIDVAQYFQLEKREAEGIAKRFCQLISGSWESIAKGYGLNRSQIELMRPAFNACKWGA